MGGWLPHQPAPRLPTEDNFSEYRRLILGELERLNLGVKEIDGKIDRLQAFNNKDMSELRVEIAMLKVKAALGGTLGGLIAGAIIGKLLH